MADLTTFFASINLGDLNDANALTSRIVQFMKSRHPVTHASMPKPQEAGDSEARGFSSYQEFGEYMYELAMFFEQHDKSAYLEFWFSMVIDDPDQVKDYLFPPMGYSPEMQEKCLQLLKTEYDFDSFVATGNNQIAEKRTAGGGQR